MAKAKKLPSGNWRVLVFYMDGGVRKRKSITAPTKKEAEYQASEFLMHVTNPARTTERLTVGEAIDRYIASKSAVLSPSTIRGYKMIQKAHLKNIKDMLVGEITQEDVQIAINEEAKKCAPKTVKNIHGLLSAAVAVYRSDLLLRTRLPQKAAKDIYVPSMEQIGNLINTAKGTDMELPILLASMMGLRRSEICGLQWGDVDLVSGRLYVQHAAVRNESNTLVVKGTKTTAGTRVLNIPEQVRVYLQGCNKTDGSIVKMKPDEITNRFERLRVHAGLPDLRFHDLRHYYASVMLALGIPDKYAMERMGHATNTMLKAVYQHTLQEKEKEVDLQISRFFDVMMK